MTKKLWMYMMFILPFVSAAQGDITLYSLRSLQQATSLNPAFMPKYNLSIGVPVFSNIAIGVQVRGFTIDDVLSSKGEDGYIDAEAFYHNLNNDVLGQQVFFQTDFFHIRQQFGHYQVALESGVRTNDQYGFSKEFVGLAAIGNNYFAGQDFSFSGTNIQASTYTQTGLSVSREFERFTIGARVKLLNGIANVSTSDIEFRYKTGNSPFETTTITIGGTANTSGLPFIEDSLNGRPYKDKDIKLENVKPFANLGFAVDLGVTYQVTNRINVQASALDLGGINWSNQVYNYNLNKAQFSFEGLTNDQFTDSTFMEHLGDSIMDIVKTTTTSHSYYTPLASRFILGADYDLSLRDRLTFMFQMQYFIKKYLPFYAISYNRRVGTNWDITANYSIYNSSYANLGIGTSVKWGAFQIYFMQDDILMYLFPKNAHTIYLRFGFNLVWGTQRERNRI